MSNWHCTECGSQVEDYALYCEDCKKAVPQSLGWKIFGWVFTMVLFLIMGGIYALYDYVDDLARWLVSPIVD